MFIRSILFDIQLGSKYASGLKARFNFIPASKCMSKIMNKITKSIYCILHWICLKLTNVHWTYSEVFICHFGESQHNLKSSIFYKILHSIERRTLVWNGLIHFSPVFNFNKKPVILFVLQIKWLVSTWNVTVGWNGLTI